MILRIRVKGMIVSLTVRIIKVKLITTSHVDLELSGHIEIFHPCYQRACQLLG